MTNLGTSMESEILQIPEVFQTILDNSKQFDKLQDVFEHHDFKSVQILARGTSDNAAHFLKYLIESNNVRPSPDLLPEKLLIFIKLNFLSG